MNRQQLLEVILEDSTDSDLSDSYLSDSDESCSDEFHGKGNKSKVQDIFGNKSKFYERNKSFVANNNRISTTQTVNAVANFVNSEDYKKSVDNTHTVDIRNSIKLEDIVLIIDP